MSEENLTKEQLLKRFAETQGVSEEEANNLIGGETADDVLINIKKFTEQKIRQSMPPMNRAQRRAWEKKQRRNRNKNKNNIKLSQAEQITDTAQKLNYIDLIQKLRILNEQKEKEIIKNEDTTESNL